MVTHLRERVVDALRHLGRRGLGVGEAEDALGDRAGQHQAQRALREDVRLAGAGVGAHPGGGARVGGLALRALGALEVARSDERAHGVVVLVGGRPFGDARQVRVVVVGRSRSPTRRSAL